MQRLQFNSYRLTAQEQEMLELINQSGSTQHMLTGDDFSGGRDSDTFVLVLGEGTDIIISFHLSEDLLGLVNGLTIEELTITQGSGGNTSHALLNTDTQTFAIIKGVDANDLIAIASGSARSAIANNVFVPV